MAPAFKRPNLTTHQVGSRRLDCCLTTLSKQTDAATTKFEVA